MSALVLGQQPLNKNSSRMTKQQHAMLHEREIADRRIDGANALLKPMAQADM